MTSILNKKIAFIKIISFVALVLLLVLGPMRYIAYADNTSGVLGVTASYSSDIEPRDNDNFVIKYKNKDTGEEDSLKIDASDVNGIFKDFDMPAGSYQVTDITYSGTNDDIVESGYGIENSFRIQAGSDDIVHIYIGASETKGLENDYNQAVIKDSEHDENGQRTVFEDENGKYIYQKDETDNNVKVYIDETGSDSSSSDSSDSEDTYQDDYKGSSADIPTQTPTGQEPITEYYDEEDETEQQDSPSSIGTSIGLVCIIALAGGVIIFILHKKGKI